MARETILFHRILRRKNAIVLLVIGAKSFLVFCA